MADRKAKVKRQASRRPSAVAKILAELSKPTEKIIYNPLPPEVEEWWHAHAHTSSKPSY